MVKIYYRFLIKKGLKLLFTSPSSLYYKIKVFRKRMIDNSNMLKINVADLHHQVLVDKYIPFYIDFVLDIIIPIYNGYEYLIKLMEQLLSHTHIKYHIILIDDCSTDCQINIYLEYLGANFNRGCYIHRISIYKHNKNMGFIQTVNEGMLLAKNHFIILFIAF